jgi:YegS/Rv2252/BmrU family lipid kinase
MSVPHAKVIVNPAAGGHSIRREWPRISRQLRDIGLSFDDEHTVGKGHAIELARAATDSGYRYLIAVGGDGTINEVANGILRSTTPGNAILGIISAGTARSFARSAGIPLDYTSACSLLTGQKRLQIDVGVVEYESRGKSLQRFFVNEADVGFGAAVIEASKHLPRQFGRTINYALHSIPYITSLLSHRNKRVTLHIGNKVKTVSVCAMVVANGGYFGGGMHIAPDAKLDDGLLDVLIAGEIGKLELLKICTKLWGGNHITHPKISVEKVTSAKLQSPERVFIEVDGEILGEGPASFRVMPSALTIVV